MTQPNNVRLLWPLQEELGSVCDGTYVPGTAHHVLDVCQSAGEHKILYGMSVAVLFIIIKSGSNLNVFQLLNG